MLDVLYEDEDLIAINKPHGLAVHRSKLIGNTDQFALQILRDQLGQHINPIHRLDRKTAGVLLFAKKLDLTSAFQHALGSGQKSYVAIVRGFIDERGNIDKALINEKGVSQSAQTNYNCLQHTEINIPQGNFDTSRYSLVHLMPQTGRMHQIRKHLNHLRHPIIGDRPHGCNKQNKFFLDQWNMGTMMLHAAKLKLSLPSGEEIEIRAPFSKEFERMTEVLNFDREFLNL
jgi:tRNA pseudouridine65 synthase